MPFSADQMDAGEQEYGSELVARMAVRLIGDGLEAKGVTASGLKERGASLIRSEGQRREPAVPVMNGYGVAVAGAEARRLVEEAARTGRPLRSRVPIRTSRAAGCCSKR